VRPSEPQRAALNDLQSASSKALATMATACKGKTPESPKAQLAMVDARLEAMSQAVRCCGQRSTRTARWTASNSGGSTSWGQAVMARAGEVESWLS
jgi:hypothetical protein